MDITLEKVARQKKISRDIVKEILDFGVTESQKFDIIFNICLSLEDNQAMKEITNMIKKYKTSVNKEKEENNILNNEKKIILS